MEKRIPKDIFYEQGTVGLTMPEEPGDEFFRSEAEPRPKEHPFTRYARKPFTFAGLVFGLGFFTVFINQAPLLYQLVLGAPIFEEMVKFGLALLMLLGLISLFAGARLPDSWTHRAWSLLGVPLALAVGAGFGFMEHFLTYAAEDTVTYVGRVIFHAVSAGMSMALFMAVARDFDARTRWLAMAPAMFIHYLNNAGALVFGIGGFILGIPIDMAWSAGLVAVMTVFFGWATIWPAPFSSMVRRLAARLPRSTRPVAVPSSVDHSPATPR